MRAAIQRSMILACLWRRGDSAGPSEPSRAELAEAYAAQIGHDVTALPFWHALGLWKIAIICEGVRRRALLAPRPAVPRARPSASEARPWVRVSPQARWWRPSMPGFMVASLECLRAGAGWPYGPCQGRSCRTGQGRPICTPAASGPSGRRVVRVGAAAQRCAEHQPDLAGHRRGPRRVRRPGMRRTGRAGIRRPPWRPRPPGCAGRAPRWLPWTVSPPRARS